MEHLVRHDLEHLGAAAEQGKMVREQRRRESVGRGGVGVEQVARRVDG